MEQYIVKGGKALAGEVTIGGAKNAALAVLAAAIMTDETVTIENLPDIRDIKVLLQAIEEIGGIVERVSKHVVKINGSNIKSMNISNIKSMNIDNEFIRKIRASYYLLGSLLGKYKCAQVVWPGGCNIGSRPIDQHIKGFEALGAEVAIQHGMIHAKADRLIGSHIYLDVVSVGATINVMMAAAMAEGQTILENAAKEPHVVDVANFLNSMGANIKGAGTDVIRIKGVEKLHGSVYSIIPDQIEAGTFMLAAAATKGDVLVKNVNVKTLPYPGFPTDMQAQMTAVLALSHGTSVVTESIFENRFKYVDELAKMGATIKVESNSAIVDGVERLSGAIVQAPDLRAGAALVIAGLVAEGFTCVENIEYVERGYESFEQKLRDLGASIEKVPVNDEKAIQKFKLKVS